VRQLEVHRSRVEALDKYMKRLLDEPTTVRVGSRVPAHVCSGTVSRTTGPVLCASRVARRGSVAEPNTPWRRWL
jgi:hypothetical protein